MKKSLFLFLLFLSPVFSKILIKEEIFINNSNEEIFAIGEKIHINGILKNEFIGAAKNIEGEFKIKNDFLSLSLFTQNISCIAEKDLYLIGNNIILSGEIKGSLTCIGKRINLKDAEVRGNLRILGENVSLENVKNFQKSFIYGKRIKISGIFSDLIINGRKIEIEKETEINGNLTYYSPEKIEFPEVQIKGKIKWKKPYSEKIKEKTTILRRIKFLYSFLSLLIPFLIFFIFSPNLLKSTTITVGEKFLISFFSGLFFIFIFLLLIAISFIIIVGIPFGLIIVSIFGSMLYLSRGFLFIFLARKIFFKFENKKWVWVLSIFVGILLFNFICLNSTVKIIANLISIPSGFGGLLMDRLKLLKRLREEKIL